MESPKFSHFIHIISQNGHVFVIFFNKISLDFNYLLVMSFIVLVMRLNKPDFY